MKGPEPFPCSFVSNARVLPACCVSLCSDHPGRVGRLLLPFDTLLLPVPNDLRLAVASVYGGWSMDARKAHPSCTAPPLLPPRGWPMTNGNSGQVCSLLRVAPLFSSHLLKAASASGVNDDVDSLINMQQAASTTLREICLHSTALPMCLWCSLPCIRCLVALDCAPPVCILLSQRKSRPSPSPLAPHAQWFHCLGSRCMTRTTRGRQVQAGVTTGGLDGLLHAWLRYTWTTSCPPCRAAVC